MILPGYLKMFEDVLIERLFSLNSLMNCAIPLKAARIQDLGFRDLGFRIQNAECRIWILSPQY
jgi:hypothetical protein